MGVFPRWCSAKQPTCNAGDARNVIQSLNSEDPLEEDMATLSGILEGRFL